MVADLAIKTADTQSLDAFVASLRRLIGCEHWEERQSSNYVEERYYRCFVLRIEITAAIADSVGFDDSQFWLHFAPSADLAENDRTLQGMADRVARTLALHSYEVIRPHDMLRTGGLATLYQLNPDPSDNLRDRVKITEIEV
jgi:hypothetical protein